MKLLLICLMFLFCANTADAGILNVFYTHPDVQVARINARQENKTNKHNRKVQREQNRHAAQSDMYNMTAPFAVPLYQSRPLIQYQSVYPPQQYMQYRWSTTIKRGSSCGCTNNNCKADGPNSCSCK